MGKGPSKILVIDPGIRVPELDCFNQLSLSSPLACTYHQPALAGMRSLNADSEPAAGLILLGSSASVNDLHDWQEELCEWLTPRLETTPILGLCYGHQLIARLHGAPIDFVYSDNRKLSGLRSVEISPENRWGYAGSTGKVVVTHREAVTAIPTDMEVFVRSSDIPVEGLRHRSKPIWTLQSHPEATLEFLHNQSIDGVNAPDSTFGKTFVQQFLQFCVSNA